MRAACQHARHRLTGPRPHRRLGRAPTPWRRRRFSRAARGTSG